MHAIVSFIAQYTIVIPVASFAYLFWKLKKQNRIKLIVVSVLALILTFVLVKIATTLHQDPRPFTHPGVQPYFTSSTDNGFPSDHTTFSVLIGLIVLHFRRKLGISLVLLGLLIGGCRVIANVHHVQDVIGGFIIAVLGFAITLLIYRNTPLSRHDKA